MKKTFIALMVFCLFLMPFAKSEDLKSYSIKQLIELKHQINEELISRFSTDTMYSGVYVVGKDIAPGTYLFTAENITAEKSDTLFIAVCENMEEFKNLVMLTYENVKVGETVHFLLEEGMVVKINRGSCTVTPDFAK